MQSTESKAAGLFSIGLLALVFFAAILFLNWTFTFCSDDCYYALDLTREINGVHPKLGNLMNVWRANWTDGYRPVVHFFVRLFTGCLGKWPFNIANTAMMFCLFVCIFRLARRKNFWECDLGTAILLFTLVFFVLCKGESYLWCAGSVNYLWSAVGSLAFCLMARRLNSENLSWPVVALYGVLAVFAGWLQEAFVLPIFCALAAYQLLHWRTLTMKKCLVAVCYVVGIALLVRVAVNRVATMPPLTPKGFIINLIKIAVAAKGVWILLLVFLLKKDKRDFIIRNLFSLLVVGASVSMIVIVGFNGERSLWAANLFSIAILVREINLGKKLSRILLSVLIATLGTCCFLGFRIKSEFDAATQRFLESDDGLCWHNRVDCGLFAKFFHQTLLSWEDDGNNMFFAHNHGRSDPPISVPKIDYDALTSGSLCTQRYKLDVTIEAYTNPQSTTIYVPLSDSAPTPRSVEVVYDLPQGLLAALHREIAIRKNPPPPHPNSPRTVRICGKRYALVSKLPGSDPYIRDVKLGYAETKDSSNVKWHKI